MYSILEKYALYSYELLLLQQPHLKIEGIYKSNNEFLIKCENINIRPLNSKYDTVAETFNNEIKIAGCPVNLVTDLPDHSLHMEARKPLDIINLAGNPFNITDFNEQFSLILPKKLPNLYVNFKKSILGFDIIVERELLQSEKDIVSEKINIFCGYNIPINYIVDVNVQKQFKRKTSDNLSLIISRHSPLNYNKALMNKWERDEELWVDNRKKLFLDESFNKIKKHSNISSCLINGSFGEAHDIRNYLTLFSDIKIVVPIESNYEALLKSLNVKEDELLELLELNKVKLLFPYSLNLYDKNIVEKAAIINPDNIILSRELACLTLTDLKRRNPFIFLPKTIDEKKEVLSDLVKLAMHSSDSNNRKWLEGLIYELSNSWSYMYENLSFRGALGTFNVGLGPIINTTIKSLTGKDYLIEIMEASNSIEWAAANQAILCPVGPLSQNEINLAHLYSGVRNDWELNLITKPNIATDGILSIANHVPVLELAETFSGTEIDRFRELVTDLTHNKNSEDLEIVIQEFNKSVKSFEKKSKHLEMWDIKGIILDSAIEITNSAIPFSGFITKQIGRILNYCGEHCSALDQVLRNVEAKTHLTSPNVILVSKMRNKIKDLL